MFICVLDGVKYNIIIQVHLSRFFFYLYNFDCFTIQLYIMFTLNFLL